MFAWVLHCMTDSLKTHVIWTKFKQNSYPYLQYNGVSHLQVWVHSPRASKRHSARPVLQLRSMSNNQLCHLCTTWATTQFLCTEHFFPCKLGAFSMHHNAGKFSLLAAFQFVICLHCDAWQMLKFPWIPNQVIDAEGEVLSEPSALLQVWKMILCTTKASFIPSIIYSFPSSTHIPANSSNCQELNLPISIEVELAIARLNLNKAWLDNIQGTYLNHPALTPLLYRLFSLCFDSVSSDWCSALIHPILKPNTMHRP